MKIKSNVRAGSGGATGTGQNGNSKSGTSVDSSSSINNTVVTYVVVPAISRCVGI